MMLYVVLGIDWGHDECGENGQDPKLLCTAWRHQDYRQATSQMQETRWFILCWVLG